MEPEIQANDFGFVYLDVANPIIAWLAYRRELVSPDISGINQGNLSWFFVDVVQRGLASTLRREGALEAFRVSDFRNKISRLQCIYAYPTLDDAKRGDYGRGKFNKSNLVSISPANDTYRREIHDSSWISVLDSLTIDSARRYWCQEYDSPPHNEMLLSGRFYILGTTLRKRAYQTVKSAWPKSLCLLEIARLAVEFGSDFGRIAPWGIREEQGIRISYLINYDEKDCAEILKQALHRCKQDPNFHIDWRALEPLRKPAQCSNADAEFSVPDTRAFENSLRLDKLDELLSVMADILRRQPALA